MPGEKNHAELARNRQTETSRFEAGGVNCINSSTIVYTGVSACESAICSTSALDLIISAGDQQIHVG